MTLPEQLKDLEFELDRLKRYFDKPKKETIERIEKEIKQLKEKK